jgi:hypothetical protein
MLGGSVAQIGRRGYMGGPSASVYGNDIPVRKRGVGVRDQVAGEAQRAASVVVRYSAASGTE